jgi:hypothetical protein
MRYILNFTFGVIALTLIGFVVIGLALLAWGLTNGSL